MRQATSTLALELVAVPGKDLRSASLMATGLKASQRWPEPIVAEAQRALHGQTSTDINTERESQLMARKCGSEESGSTLRQSTVCFASQRRVWRQLTHTHNTTLSQQTRKASHCLKQLSSIKKRQPVVTEDVDGMGLGPEPTAVACERGALAPLPCLAQTVFAAHTLARLATHLQRVTCSGIALESQSRHTLRTRSPYLAEPSVNDLTGTARPSQNLRQTVLFAFLCTH